MGFMRVLSVGGLAHGLLVLALIRVPMVGVMLEPINGLFS